MTRITYFKTAWCAACGVRRAEWSVKQFRIPHSAFRIAKGQATLEYAVVIAVVVVALLAMQVYMRGGVQGKLRDAADQVGEQFSPTAYHGRVQVVQKSATEETLHVGNQPKGESKSETLTVGNVAHISTQRLGQDIGTTAGVYEQSTNGQSSEGCLFPPCSTNVTP